MSAPQQNKVFYQILISGYSRSAEISKLYYSMIPWAIIQLLFLYFGGSLDTIDQWDSINVEYQYKSNNNNNNNNTKYSDNKSLEISSDGVKLYLVDNKKSRFKSYKIYGANIIDTRNVAREYVSSIKTRKIHGNRICFEWILELLTSTYHHASSSWKCGLQSMIGDDIYGISGDGNAFYNTNCVKVVNYLISKSMKRFCEGDELIIKMWIEPSSKQNIATFLCIDVEFYINSDLILEYKNIDFDKMRLFALIDSKAGFVIKSFDRMIK